MRCYLPGEASEMLDASAKVACEFLTGLFVRLGDCYLCM